MHMQITDMRTTKRGRIAVYLDGEFSLSVHPDVAMASGIRIGMQIDEEALEELVQEAELKKAKEKALSLLSYKEYTTKQLTERLTRHVDEEIAQVAAERMQELGLLDDDDYAKRFARDLSTRKHFGVRRIKQEMHRRGLCAEQIDSAIEQLDTDTDADMRAIIARKYSRAYEDEKIKRRAFAALVRMGYAPGEIRRVLRAELEDGYD